MSVSIPNSVTGICSYAFSGCTSLTSIEIPDSVTNVASNAFSGCTNLTSINVNPGNKSYTSIDGNLYTKDMKMLVIYTQAKNDEEFVIPDSVTKIADSAFAWCKKLTSITIPDSVTEIGNQAFLWCEGLTSITVPGSVTSIGYGTFLGCTGLTSIIISDGVTEIGDHAFNQCTSLKNIILPNSVTKIGTAFHDCTSLTSITIPDGVTSIDGYAFQNCTSLTSITIPNSVTEIGESTFEGCKQLASIIIPDSVTKIGAEAFKYCGCKLCFMHNAPGENWDQNWKNYFLGEIIWNYETEEMKTRRLEAERKAEILKCCQIEDGVLKEFKDPNNKITEVVIPDGVTSISDHAFSDCKNLTSITIPESVKSIGYGAFSGCTSLTQIAVDENNPEYKNIDGNHIYTKDGKTLVHYAVGNSAEAFIIPQGITSICSCAFSGCGKLTSITIPDSVTSIDSSAFSGCTCTLNICHPKPGLFSKTPEGWHKDWSKDFKGKIVWNYKK